MTLHFADLHPPRPTRESLDAEFASIHADLDAGTAEHRAAALLRWERERRRFESWSALVHLRFSQDTTSPEAKADRDYADMLSPEATRHDVAVKRRLLDEPDRARLIAEQGAHRVRLWETDITTFDPAIAPSLEEESRLCADYTELLASARLEIDGTHVNLSGLAPFQESLDRDTRHRAEQARWAFFEANSATLDTLYDQLVTLRHGMAGTLGFPTYTPLGYRRMRRIDYGPAEVAAFRGEVVRHVVPLVGRLLEQRRSQQGWDTLRAWDENLIDPAGNPRPVGGHDMLIDRATAMFDRMGPTLGDFFRMMNEGGFLDLRNREGKAGGGFCTSFPEEGIPFIFANFNGTHHDITVFTHEMGHAYQNWESRNLPGIDLLWPTMDAAEINSMGLEFLTWPHMELMVEAGAADRYRRMHLISSLSFLPYGVCVDHFQHEIYADPTMGPEARHALWRRLERIYLPWRDYGDLAYPANGGRWQAQMHIYRAPFYYIDYTLALCCAMQFWLAARRDPDDAMRRYIDLCARGGSAPFTELVASAGLVSPFIPGVLQEVVREAEALLSA
jgi:M3 family oligoendopeptidase